MIKQAQDQHLRAHILWEYWTAENSDGFHNPELARESIAKSIDESQKGIKIINDALEPADGGSAAGGGTRGRPGEVARTTHRPADRAGRPRGSRRPA